MRKTTDDLRLKIAKRAHDLPMPELFELMNIVAVQVGNPFPQGEIIEEREIHDKLLTDLCLVKDDFWLEYTFKEITKYLNEDVSELVIKNFNRNADLRKPIPKAKKNKRSRLRVMFRGGRTFPSVMAFLRSLQLEKPEQQLISNRISTAKELKAKVAIIADLVGVRPNAIELQYATKENIIRDDLKKKCRMNAKALGLLKA